MADALPAWRRMAMLLIAKPDLLAVETIAAKRPWVARARKRRTIACWTVRTRAERAALSDRVDHLIWEGDGRP